LDGDGQVHRNGLSVEQGRLILPLAKRVHGRLMEKRWSEDHLHSGDASISLNQGVDANVAGNMLGSRQRWL